MAGPQKITFGDMRESGVRGVLIYCSDYRCSHHIAVSGDRWEDDVRLSDIEPHFVCSACASVVQTCGQISRQPGWASAKSG
jgi:hypothetical protein